MANKILPKVFQKESLKKLKKNQKEVKVVLLLLCVKVSNRLSNSYGFSELWIIRSAMQPLEVLAARSLNTEVECRVLAVQE